MIWSPVSAPRRASSGRQQPQQPQQQAQPVLLASRFSNATRARHAGAGNTDRNIAMSIIKRFASAVPPHITFINRDGRTGSERLVRYMNMKRYVSKLSGCSRQVSTIDQRPATSALKYAEPGRLVQVFDNAQGTNYKTTNAAKDRKVNALVNKELGRGSYGQAYSVRGAAATWMTNVKFAVKVAQKMYEFETEKNVLEALTTEVKKNRFMNLPMMYGHKICDPSNILSSSGPLAYIPDLEQRSEAASFRGWTVPTGVLYAEKASGALMSFLGQNFTLLQTGQTGHRRTAAQNAVLDRKLRSCIMQCLISLLKMREMKYYHNDAHQGNFLYHEVEPGGYWWYKINDVDLFVKNEGMVCVPWDFGLTKRLDMNLSKDKSPVVDFLHLMSYIKCRTQNYVDMSQSMHDFINEVYCILARIASQRLGTAYWKYLTHPFTEHADTIYNRSPNLQPTFGEMRLAPLINHDDFFFTVFKLAHDIDVSSTYESLVSNGTLHVMKENTINKEQPFEIKTTAIAGTNPNFLRRESEVQRFMMMYVREFSLPTEWWVRGNIC